MSDALSALEIGGKTAKRATWEAFEFDVPSRGLVVVTNASYGAEKDEHVHSVTVESGVPTSCSCKADEYQEGACKHRVAVAIAEPVLEAASAEPERPVATDGGQVVESTPERAGETQGSDVEDALPEITEHVESPRQGGARFIRCEGCGEEVIGTDESRLVHREGCAHAVGADHTLPAREAGR